MFIFDLILFGCEYNFNILIEQEWRVAGHSLIRYNK
jgi:hypothetical protein